VESVPGKVSGAWVFRGTRIPVAAVFENLEDRLTVNEIVEMFDGLKQEQVKAYPLQPIAPRSLSCLIKAPRSASATLCQDIRVRTAAEQGWSTLMNGQLLHAAEQAGFDVLLTDRY
jgi:hypothetical protein